MRFFALIMVAALVFGFCACNFGTASGDTVTTTYNYIYTPSEATSFSEETQTVASAEETTQPYTEAQTQLQEEGVTQETTTLPPETTTAVAETTTVETTVPAEATTEHEQTTMVLAETTSSSALADFSLNMSVPDANGTMEVDLSEENKYTQIVAAQRGIDTSLLVAVYSVPESGQNYVFEFLSAGAQNRTAENIRRVYLIDSSGKITYVSAASAAEAENVSAVENWFNMNVLIKGMIFPAIEEKMK